MLHLGNIADAAEDSCRNEPFDGLFKITRPAARAHGAVHELLVRLGELGNDASEDQEDARTVDLAVMLGKIVFVNLDEFMLDARDLQGILRFLPGRDAFGHAADDQIMVAGFEQTVVEDFLNRLPFLYARVISVKRRIRRGKKFIKGQRPEIEQIDHADRIRLRLGKERSEQAARRDGRIVARFFLEVFECVQR